METKNLFGESGIIITLILVLIPLLCAAIIVIIKAYAAISQYAKRKELEVFNEYLTGIGTDEIEKLEQQKRALEFSLSNNELAGETIPVDNKGLINNIQGAEPLRFIEQKKKSQPRPYIEPDLTRLILWYLGCAACWLLLGTTAGEIVGIKFISPDIDHYSWLSFGRLRPVHTNAVFWGWASLAMLGLAYYVVPRVSNVPIASIKTAIAIEGISENAIVDGTVPLMINAYDKGDQNKFNIEGSETPQTVPWWLIVGIIVFTAWTVYYIITSSAINS